ncbi:MAG: O-methyltransferase [Lentihominibacter sp.]
MDITNRIVSAYIDDLYTCDNEKLKDLRSFAEDRRVPIILRSTEMLLTNLLKIRKPEHILEIGAAVGYSASVFADACGCRVTTIEADENSYNIACSNIKSLDLDDKITVLYGDARDVLEKLSLESDRFDVVFIDAAKSHYKAFWDLAVPLCTDDALVICDNVLMKGMTVSDECDPNRKYKTSIRKMREFIKYITNLNYAETCVLPVGDGVSLSVIDKELMTI